MKGKPLNQKPIRSAALAVASALWLSGCVNIQLSSGSGGIDGSGLDDRSPPSFVDRMLGTQPRITVLETRGDLYAFQTVVERERVPPSYGLLTTAKGSAKVQMPDGVVYELGADTSVEFKLEGGKWMPMLERGTIRAPAKAPVSTPMVSMIVCEGSWEIRRNASSLTVTNCPGGSVRWLPGTAATPLTSAAVLQLDEPGRKVSDSR
jgi:hypothetical protein